ncbi:TolB family protein [Actinoplanes sp. GCM10030250]|uniref:TolB family protein n=1 Tax=Actinoplanes sp. GCM10030250 TaxID=3273376 RepID=UPI003607260A
MSYARKLTHGQRCRILVYDLTSESATVVHTDSAVLFEAPNWSAGGDLILNGDGLLWRLPSGGSAPPRQIPLEGVPELNNDHVLAPGSETIFLSANDGHIYEAPLHGGPGRRVTPDDGLMHFLHGVSPDGTTLAYVGIENQRWDAGSLFTMATDGSATTPLTPAPGGPDDGPEYSPAGDWIYFNTERFSTAPGHAQIARIRPDGSDMHRLTTDDRVNWFPHPSPDGARTVYLSYPPGTTGHPADLPVELRLVDGDAWDSPRTVAKLPGGQGTINVNSWSPDSTRFAYVEYPERNTNGGE